MNINKLRFLIDILDDVTKILSKTAHTIYLEPNNLNPKLFEMLELIEKEIEKEGML